MFFSARSCWCCILIYASIASFSIQTKTLNYGKGFHNQSRCLYSYMEGGLFKMNTAYGDVISERVDLDSLAYDPIKTKCTKKNEHGKLVFSFRLDEKTKIKTITISMRVEPSLSEGTWNINQANLTITRADLNKKRTFPLRVQDIYASLGHSYSCNELVLRTVHEKKSDNETGRIEPRAELTLKRFQMQPFPELANVVFGPSYDCSTWLTIPGLMGLILITFMTTFIIVGVYFLKEIETNDFKYNKEGQLFTQSQLESSKHQ